MCASSTPRRCATCRERKVSSRLCSSCARSSSSRCFAMSASRYLPADSHLRLCCSRRFMKFATELSSPLLASAAASKPGLFSADMVDIALATPLIRGETTRESQPGGHEGRGAASSPPPPRTFVLIRIPCSLVRFAPWEHRCCGPRDRRCCRARLRRQYHSADSVSSSSSSISRIEAWPQ
jgi:hypothetical protein